MGSISGAASTLLPINLDQQQSVVLGVVGEVLRVEGCEGGPWTRQQAAIQLPLTGGDGRGVERWLVVRPT